MFFSVGPRPKREFEVKRCGRSEWKKFAKYHYLREDLSSSAQCFGLYDEGTMIGFCAVLHQPHPKNDHIKRCSRLVILPDYQGIGLGKKFLGIVADYYVKKNFDFTISTSARNLISGLKKDEGWMLKRYNVDSQSGKKGIQSKGRSSWKPRKVKTATFKKKV